MADGTLAGGKPRSDTPDPSAGAARAAAEAAARHGYGRLLAFLAARTGDVGAAEDALADAFAAALSDWPASGIPDRPEAWLLTVARRRLIDAVRRRQTTALAETELRRTMVARAIGSRRATIPDHRLALMFVCAHPAIDPGIRAALMLQTVLGFDAASIASAFLVSPVAMRQRLARAKTKIRQAGIAFRVPDRALLAERLPAVLDAIYAVYSEGWSDPAGTDSRRSNLAGEGLWLGRLVTALLPDEPEALGLLALMLHAEARRGARRDASGGYVPLDAQDPVAWDPATIAEAEALLFRAAAAGRPGRYQLEAAVQSAHAARRLTGRTDWAAILGLYDALATLTGSPVVAINRAVAVAECAGAKAGLAALESAAAGGRLADYQPYWAARAGLLARRGAAGPAREAYRRAIGLERDRAVRDFLIARAAALPP
ncbi:MAG TPA: DUF6596 domain-containing protein [Acetobacteraceae bacterium]|nr:DUF6596 domain-containing protein [Acetobacteraceae bacterium]